MRVHAKTFGEWKNLSKNEQITALRIALLDDAPEDAKPSFWSKVWGVVKTIAPIAATVGRMVLNPEEGHLQEVSLDQMAQKSIREDRKTF